MKRSTALQNKILTLCLVSFILFIFFIDSACNSYCSASSNLLSDSLFVKSDSTRIRPYIIVKFIDDSIKGIDYSDEFELNISPKQKKFWNDLKKLYPTISLNRALPSLNVPKYRIKLERIKKTAEEKKLDHKPANYLSFFVIRANARMDIVSLVKDIRKWNIVEYSYIERPSTPFVVVGTPTSLYSQGYLESAPIGIGAKRVWQLEVVTGNAIYKGEGQKFIDVEWDWLLEHEALRGHNVDPNAKETGLHGGVDRHHGTGVLCIVCAHHNNLPCKGIAPNIDSLGVISPLAPPYYTTIAEAITRAIGNLNVGDVLLIEMQIYLDTTFEEYGISLEELADYNGYRAPIEANPLNYEVIKEAADSGIVVIEAAANGDGVRGLPLDKFGIFYKDSSQFRDSQAIMVAAAEARRGHRKISFSNYGKRIDCFAWGEQILTCYAIDYLDPSAPKNLYRDGSSTSELPFGGTSGAAAIVAGAALLVQGVADGSPGGRISNSEMREYIRSIGTPSIDSNLPLVVMPNVYCIAAEILECEEALRPDIYIRDSLSDRGDVPQTGPVFLSPDIIVSSTDYSDSATQAEFGEGSGLEDMLIEDLTIQAEQDNYIYLRIQNRYCKAAENVKATVYWSETSTLVLPELWKLIGDVNISTVPGGNLMIVTEKIIWPAERIPAEGNYCFIAVIGNPEDPAPSINIPGTMDDFMNLIRKNNNIAWRNFKVVSSDTGETLTGELFEEYMEIPFYMNGAPDENRQMAIEISSNLPDTVEIIMEVPNNFEDDEVTIQFKRLNIKKKNIFLKIPRPYTRILSKRIIKARKRIPIKLYIKIPPQLYNQNFNLSIKQLWKDSEVGRITYYIPADTEKKGILKLSKSDLKLK